MWAPAQSATGGVAEEGATEGLEKPRSPGEIGRVPDQAFERLAGPHPAPSAGHGTRKGRLSSMLALVLALAMQQPAAEASPVAR